MIPGAPGQTVAGTLVGRQLYLGDNGGLRAGGRWRERGGPSEVAEREVPDTQHALGVEPGGGGRGVGTEGEAGEMSDRVYVEIFVVDKFFAYFTS